MVSTYELMEIFLKAKMDPGHRLAFSRHLSERDAIQGKWEIPLYHTTHFATIDGLISLKHLERFLSTRKIV